MIIYGLWLRVSHLVKWENDTGNVLHTRAEHGMPDLRGHEKSSNVCSVMHLDSGSFVTVCQKRAVKYFSSVAMQMDALMDFIEPPC